MKTLWKTAWLAAAITLLAAGCGQPAAQSEPAGNAALEPPSFPQHSDTPGENATSPPDASEPKEGSVPSEPDSVEQEQEAIKANYYMDQNYIIRPKSEEIEKNVVLLTFDDAPKDEAVLRSILDTLDQFHAKAIFFVNGYRAEQHPELLRLIADRGHPIGNHAWDHVNLREVPAEDLEKQIGDVQRLVEEITGEAPLFFRPPHGAGNDAVRSKAAEYDLLYMNWSNGSRDWMDGYQETDQIIDSVMEQLHAGSNILMHELPWTAEALEPLLTRLQEKGYRFVHPAEIDLDESSNG